MQLLKIAGSCLNQTPLDWEGNLQHILTAIDKAKNEQVALLLLPELAISGYGCEDTFFSDYVPERSINSLLKIVDATDDIAVSVGLPMVYENSVYNVVCFIFNKKILGFVAKQELAGDGIHYEPRWFKPWQEYEVGQITIQGNNYPFGDLIFEVDGVRIGFEICEDAWNGVRPAQRHYLNNVDIILNPSASHFAFGKTKIRQGLVVEASRSYSCAYVYSNLLGNEAGRVIYDGEILIAQSGTLLARNKRFSFEDVQLLTAVIDVDLPRRSRKKVFSFQHKLSGQIEKAEGFFPQPERLSEPQIAPIMEKNEEFYQAVTLGMFDYMRKSYSKGFTLSLSGGADSSACAVLSAFAWKNAESNLAPETFQKKTAYLKLNPDRPALEQLLTCIYQATDNSTEATRTSARELALGLGAVFYDWNIQQPLNDYHALVESSIQRGLNWQQDDIALQNIQARVRVPALWMIANLNGSLLLTTSNRSEAAVGYATMDGDTAGGLAPLGGIDKATLLEWLKWAEKELNIDALKYVNSLKPSAELRPPDQEQTDEKDLMPYPILDKIEKCAIRDYKSPKEVFQTLRGIVPDEVLKGYIKKFFTLWARNQWKRERYAPSFHLDDANLDPRTWCRFPILNGGWRVELEELMREM